MTPFPLNHTHAIIFEWTLGQQAGGDIRGTYLEKLPKGWYMAEILDYSGQHGVVGEAELAKSW